MLDAFGVTEANWRDALDRAPGDERPSAPPDFALSESPRYVGRAVAALAPIRTGRAGTSSRSTPAGSPHEYGFTDVDGSQPDVWRFIGEARDRGDDADLADYR